MVLNELIRENRKSNIIPTASLYVITDGTKNSIYNNINTVHSQHLSKTVKKVTCEDNLYLYHHITATINEPLTTVRKTKIEDLNAILQPTENVKEIFDIRIFRDTQQNDNEIDHILIATLNDSQIKNIKNAYIQTIKNTISNNSVIKIEVQ